MAGSRGQVWTSTNWILALKTTLGLCCFEDLRALGREILSQKELVCSLLFQPTAENCCETLGFGAGAPPRCPPFAVGQMACPWLTASLAGAAAAGICPLPIPAPHLRGMEQDLAPSPGKMQGGTCPTPCECFCPWCLLCVSKAIFWGESHVFLSSRYILCGAGSVGSCPRCCRIQEEQQSPAASAGESTRDLSEAPSVLQSICAFMGVFLGGFHPSPCNENPFYLPERSILLPCHALGQPDPSRRVIHPSGDHHLL